jgi:hypothetical protein
VTLSSSWRTLVVFSAGMLSAAFLACGGDEASTPPPEAQPPERLAITASEFKFDTGGTNSVGAGLVSIVLDNVGKRPHQVQLLRLNEGVAFNQLRGALRDERKLLSLVSISGGAAPISPGGTQEATVNLEPGSYTLICFVEGHHLKGMVQPFEVTEDGAAASEPSSSGEITLRDFSFSLPDRFSGQGTFTVTNEGPQPHEAQIFKTDGSLPEVQRFLRNPRGAPPFKIEEAGGLGAIAPGTQAFVDLNLSPGTYAFVCFVPDRESGKPHFALGMATPFELKG